MAADWDPHTYRERSEKWRAAAAAEAATHTRDAYLAISEHYARLATALEDLSAPRPRPNDTVD